MDWCLEPARQTLIFLPSPWRARRIGHGKEREMEVLHPRCAGMDISKKDAKVCVRIAGGRKASETVTT